MTRVWDAPPRISVVVPVYNVLPWLEPFLASLAVQTMTDFEVVVVDDVSTDGSYQRLSSAAALDPRIRVAQNASHLGLARTRRVTLQLARGEWLAFVDPDDEILPQRLERMLAAATRHQADWIADDQEIFLDHNGERLGLLLVDEPPAVSATSIVHLLARDLPGRIGYGTLKPMVREAFLRRHGIVYPTLMDRGEDFLFAVTCGAAGASMHLLNEPLYRYRIRRRSATNGLGLIATALLQRQANEEALRIAARAGAAELVAALQARGRIVDQHAAYSHLIARLRAGRPIEAMAAFLAAPAAWSYGLGRLGPALARRLRRQELAFGRVGRI